MQTTSSNWYDAYVKSDSDAGIFGQYKTPEDALAAIPDMRRTISAGVRLPDTKLAGEDLINSHRGILKRLGLPETADLYDFSDVEGGLPKELAEKLPPDLFKDARQKVHRWGLLPWQAKLVMAEALDNWKQGIASREAKRAEDEKSLKELWKDKYEEHSKLTKSALERIEKEALGDEGAGALVAELEDASPVVRRALLHLYNRLYRDGSSAQTSSGAAGGGGDMELVRRQVMAEYKDFTESQIEEIVQARMRSRR